MEARVGKPLLGDVVVKRALIDSLNSLLDPIRTRRSEFEKDDAYVWDVISEGTRRGRARAGEVMEAVRSAMKLNYPVKR